MVFRTRKAAVDARSYATIAPVYSPNRPHLFTLGLAGFG